MLIGFNIIGKPTVNLGAGNHVQIQPTGSVERVLESDNIAWWCSVTHTHTKQQNKNKKKVK
jgi:hypothetical protein